MTRSVVVVGGGNAALCAALAARDAGARVVLLERAPRDEAGGNSAFTAAALRLAYDDGPHLCQLMPEVDDPRLARSDFGSYPVEAFVADMERVTEGRCDPVLTRILAERSHATFAWLHGKGARYEPSWHDQAFEVDGRFVFWGGISVHAVGEGKGLVGAERAAAEREGVEIRYGARAIALLTAGGRVVGVRVRQAGVEDELLADAVVLACGGFEANAEMRTRYLGPGWDAATVRGTRYNTGDGLRMALEAGAMPWGNWSGAHSVGWDVSADPFGDLALGYNPTRNSYPLGILVNRRGERFVDEGADFRNYTYARYGSLLLAQPGGIAWQVFGGEVLGMLRREYHHESATYVEAATLDELAAKMAEGPTAVDRVGFLRTVEAFNAAVRTDVPFDPNHKDGRGTAGIDPPKTNWANPLVTPPFRAYPTTCGITFTFGGVKIDGTGAVLDTAGDPLPGLYAAGELVGGLFWHNYPGGSGLTAGAVFGRLAGTSAATA